MPGNGRAGGERKGGEGQDGGDAERPQHHRTRASAPSVVQQARLMDSAGTAWHAVKVGNLEMITKLFPNRCNAYARGPVGENVLHTAMLLNTPSTLVIARYLIKLYGAPLVNCPFTDRKSAQDPPSAYEGQTALHIAIVNRDIDMVKFLVQHGADIRARAWGTFFAPGGPMHYGEYPLSFAACTGQKEIVAHLKRHGAAVNRDRDVHGNTALHMCVIHDQPEMYDFLADYCAASVTVRNYSGLTPLVLAAQLGKMAMFQHIYNRRRRAFYTFGKVTSYSLALREIDTVQDEDEYVPNALEVVLRKGHLDMLEEPLISTLLQHKWEAFARTQFLLHFVGYLLLEISQTILIWLISNKDLWNGAERASQEYVGLSLAIIMALFEILDYVDWSRECYHRRLTTYEPPPYQPPLYPIPGENQNAREGRQGIFSRLSQRVMARAHLNPGVSGAGAAPVAGAGSSSGGGGDSSGGGGPRIRFKDEVEGQQQQRQQQQQPAGATPAAPAVPAAEGGPRPLGEAREAARGARQPQAQQGSAPLTAAQLAEALEQDEAEGAEPEEDDVVSVGVRPPAAAAPAAAATAPSGPQQDLSRASNAPSASGSAAAPQAGGGMGSRVPSRGEVASVAGTASGPAPALADRGHDGALQRQRTRARSGGGDLPSSISALKRVATAPRHNRGDLDAESAYKRDSARSPGHDLLDAIDLEAGGGGDTDPHKGRLRAMLETTTEGFMRMLSDPWLFIWHIHLGLTFIHFITWQTTYGGVGGAGPASRAVREFDDVVVSLMGLSGWLAVIYFFRAFKPTGKLAVILERCIVDVVRFISLYILWNIGFTLAFFTMTRGSLYVTGTPRDKDDTAGPLEGEHGDHGAFSSIGWGMMSLINLGLGIGLWEYGAICNLGHQVTSVFCTIYYLLYQATSAILLLNLLIAMIIRTYNTAQKAAEAHWRRRWATYVVKAERRMPASWVQRLRLGQPAWDPISRRPMYSHVFEEVEDERAKKEDRGTLDSQIKAITELLDGLKRQRGAGGGASSSGGGATSAGGAAAGGGTSGSGAAVASAVAGA